MCAAFGLSVAFAQAAGDETSQPPASSPLSGSQLELRGIQGRLDASEEQRRKIEAEIDGMRTDRAQLNAALIDTATRLKDVESRTSEAERRLETLTGSEGAIRKSLEGRRVIIGNVLATLQRMGRKPPPALLVQPEDMLEAVRTSMLLGAVLPEMRIEAEALTGDLRELVNLRRQIASEREDLGKSQASLNSDRARIAALVAARQNSLGDAERALESERIKARDLASQVSTLKDLIARSEAESAAAQKGAEEARKAEEALARLAALQPADQQAKTAAAPFKDAARLAPAVAFAQTRGKLPMPVSGSLVKTYGATDGFGGTEKGLSIATRNAAIVSAPSDGWVVFAAPYRSYGQLLIINAGNGYYLVLAGMERISVEVGQFVLAGEPVAAMGDGGTRIAATATIGAPQPVLYVEFRKDGTAIDPGPWWAKPDLQRVRG